MYYTGLVLLPVALLLYIVERFIESNNKLHGRTESGHRGLRIFIQSFQIVILVPLGFLIDTFRRMKSVQSEGQALSKRTALSLIISFGRSVVMFLLDVIFPNYSKKLLSLEMTSLGFFLCYLLLGIVINDLTVLQAKENTGEWSDADRSGTNSTALKSDLLEEDEIGS